MNEAYASALSNALTEIQNICPDVKASFLLDKKANLIAGDVGTPRVTVDSVASALETVIEKSETIGGIDSLVVEGSKGSAHITSVDDTLLVMIANKHVDMKYLQTVSRVLIPTILKLSDHVNPTSLKQSPPYPSLFEPTEVEEAPIEEIDEPERVDEDELKEPEREPEKEPVRELDLPSNQLIVETFGGLLVRSDTVQICKDIMSEWEDAVDGKRINLVEIEAFNGEAKQCKVKSVDESKLENKAVIRIPEKICQSLDIKKGELVRVTPVVA
jgi:predicted regulator of Ras-like GTPase activity (Roadblock/LC7/MglB family)